MSQSPPRSEASEEALWRLFGSTNTAEAFCSAWLSLQCLRIRGVSGGIVLLGAPDEDRQFVPAAYWPDERANLEHLAAVAGRAVNERRGLLLKKTTAPGYEVAYPVQVKGRLLGIVALDVEPRPESELRDVMYQLQWGAAWMEVLFHRGQSSLDQAPQQRLQTVVEMLATLASHEGFHGASVALATAMATHFACDRVSVGFVGRGGMRVEAISHSAHLAKDANLMRAIAAAMEEAADQHASVVFPSTPGRESVVTRAHGELARQFGNGAICSFALTERDEVVGALTLERPGDFQFDEQTIAVCESLAALAGPMLELYRRDDRWLWRKAVDSAAGAVGKLIGPGRLGLKLGVGAAAAVIAFLALADGVYRITADTVIEPAQRQALVASFAGYVRTAPVRAGDVVSAGQVLATLDDRDLVLERGRWRSQEEQGRRQYYEALGSSRAPEIQIFSAQIDQARAQVALLEAQIGRTAITAPFAGVVVNGDLSQSLGSPVERGQVLFELAPLDSYRVVIQVDERNIADVVEGAHGELVLAGFADHPTPFVVKRLTPVSVTAEGRNFFRVEAELENAREELRPGMEGVAKIEVGERRLAWIWTHEVVDWARLKLWTWLP